MNSQESERTGTPDSAIRALYQRSASAEPWSFYIFPAICFDSITPSGDPPTRIKSVYIEFY